MLKNDVIEPSGSPWSFPIALVTKKDGSVWFCVDYRKLNEVTRKDAYSLPRIDDTLDTLSGARYFCTMDLASGYWQIEMDEKDKEKTAFITHKGVFHFKVMPFGLWQNNGKIGQSYPNNYCLNSGKDLRGLCSFKATMHAYEY